MNDLMNKRKNHIVPVEEPLILISQIQRSGGTLLAQLFDDHPECFVFPGEIEWGYPTKYDWPNLERENTTAEKAFRLLSSETFDRYISFGYSKQSWLAKERETFPLVFNKRLQKRTFLKLCKRNMPKEQRKVLNSFITSFFSSWIDYQNLYRKPKKYVVGFTPRVNMYKESSTRYFEDYPDGYMISITRHPGDWFVSAKSHNPYEYSEIENALDLWCRSSEASLMLKEDYGERFIMLNFENLIKNTEETMKGICELIKIEWNKTLLIPTFNSMPIMADSSFDVKSHGVIKDPLNRYLELLEPEENKIIKDRAIPLYEVCFENSINKF